MKNFYESTPMPTVPQIGSVATARNFFVWLYERGALEQIMECGLDTTHLTSLRRDGGEPCFLTDEMRDIKKWVQVISRMVGGGGWLALDVIEQMRVREAQEVLNNGDYAEVKIDAITKKVLSVKKVPPPSSGKNNPAEKSMLFRKGDTPSPVLQALNMAYLFVKDWAEEKDSAAILCAQLKAAWETVKKQEEEERMRHIFDLRNARKVLGRYQRTAEEPMVGMIGDAVNVIDDVIEHFEMAAGLCVDEGCPHHGTDHVCVSK